MSFNVGDIVYVGYTYEKDDTILYEVLSINPLTGKPNQLILSNESKYVGLTKQIFKDAHNDWKTLVFSIYKSAPEINKNDPNYKYIKVVNKIKQLEDKFKAKQKQKILNKELTTKLFSW